MYSVFTRITAGEILTWKKQYSSQITPNIKTTLTHLLVHFYGDREEVVLESRET